MDYNHARCFFNASEGIPRWTGYTLGFRMVRDYMESHSGITAAELVNTEAATIRGTLQPMQLARP